MKKLAQFITAARKQPGKTAMPVLLIAGGAIVLFILSGRFLLRILAIYLLPNFYIHARLKNYFFNAGQRKWFTFFYIALAAAFPVTELLSHISGLGGARYFLVAGYYSLPFLLYVFLLLLFFDLLLALNRLLRTIAQEIVQSRRFRLTSLCLIFALAGAVVTVGALNYDNTRVNEYRIEIPRRSSTLSHLRIALTADFHLGAMTHKRFMRDFVDKVNSLHPDIVLIPGDLLEGDRDDVNTAEFERQFGRIKTRYGIYASPGNHEAHGGDKAGFFSRAKITMLRDAAVTVNGEFVLVGRDDRYGGGRRPLAELLRNRDRRLPLIILDHRPNDIGEASHCGADIQLSGHSHYGQLFPLNFLTQLQYPLSWGYKKIARTHFFVTCGVQTWGPQVRTAGESEIMLIDVDFFISGVKSNLHDR